MNAKAFCLKHKPMLLIVLLGLLLTFASVLDGSARVANRELTSGMSSFDSDVLDIEGEWKVTQRAPAGTRLESGYWVPSGIASWIFRISLTRIGPNAYGGSEFKGHRIDAPWVTIHGDTFYGGRGVQVVQMRFEEDTTAGRYYKLLCGKHQLYRHDPKRIEVLGGWVDGGYERAASGYDGSFVMIKGAR